MRYDTGGLPFHSRYPAAFQTSQLHELCSPLAASNEHILALLGLFLRGWTSDKFSPLGSENFENRLQTIDFKTSTQRKRRLFLIGISLFYFSF